HPRDRGTRRQAPRLHGQLRRVSEPGEPVRCLVASGAGSASGASASAREAGARSERSQQPERERSSSRFAAAQQANRPEADFARPTQIRTEDPARPRPRRAEHPRARERARGAAVADGRPGSPPRRRAHARARRGTRGAAQRGRGALRGVGGPGRRARGRRRLAVRVALVHDWLTGLRGGERVLDVLAGVWPDADLYTLFHVPGATTPRIDALRVHASPLEPVPGWGRHYRKLLPLHPWAARRLRVDDCDLVVSVSHAVAKAVRIAPGVPHLCYCLTPMRYVWDQIDVYLGRGALRASAAPL